MLMLHSPWINLHAFFPPSFYVPFHKYEESSSDEAITELGDEGRVGTENTQSHPRGAYGRLGGRQHEANNCIDKYTASHGGRGEGSLRK